MRVSLRDIALKAGVNATTVSRALRNDPRVKQSTRDAILALANEMGYRKDPGLSALSAYREAKRKKSVDEVIGWVTNFDTPEEWQRSPTYAGIFQQMKPLAYKAGFRIEEFWTHETKLPAERLSNIMWSRGIRGLILAMERDIKHPIELRWEDFSAISLSPAPRARVLHTVGADFFHDVAIATRKLIELGSRKPIMIVHQRFEEYVGHRAKGAFCEITKAELGQTGEVFSIQRAESKNHVSKWVKSSGADAVLVTATYDYLEAMKHYPKKQLPKLYSLDSPPGSPAAGIYHDPAVIANVALEQLVAMLNRFETGIPKHPLTVHVPGKWRDL